MFNHLILIFVCLTVFTSSFTCEDMSSNTGEKEEKKYEPTKSNVISNDIKSNLKTIKVISVLHPYFPAKRLKKWEMILEQEDLDYLFDVLNLPHIQMLRENANRFTLKLYSVLLQIKQTSIYLLEIKDEKIEGTLPYNEINGIYIDRGDEFHGRKSYININSSEDKQWLLYSPSNPNRWNIHRHDPELKEKSSVLLKYAWIVSDKMDSLLSNNLQWSHYVGLINDKPAHWNKLTLSIKCLNK